MVKLDIHTLAHHLKQERLYVSSEKALIQRLNADVLKTAERLYRTAWISKQQRINLDRLIITRYCTPLCQPSQPAGPAVLSEQWQQTSAGQSYTKRYLLAVEAIVFLIPLLVLLLFMGTSYPEFANNL